jgi:hypothetical protein
MMARHLTALARLSRQFGASQAHFMGIPSRERETMTAVALWLLAAKLGALAACPLMPAFADRLWRELGHGTPLSEARWSPPIAWLDLSQSLRFSSESYF